MLTTDLSNAEIVLGKLGVRLIPVLGLIVCVLPVLALSGLMGGIDPLALGGSFLVSIGCALVGCALAMTLSVWARKTHEVVMMTYVLLVLWLIFPGLLALAMYTIGTRPPPFAAPVLWQFVIDTNPYYLAFAPYMDPTKVGLWTFLIFLGACLVTSGGLTALSTMRIRHVALSQAGRPAASPRRWSLRRLRRPSWVPRLPGPSLDFNPVAWREWHRMHPSWMMRIAWGLYAALGVFWFMMSLKQRSDPSDLTDSIAAMSAFQVALGLLLLSVGAATSLAEERVRGSLDVLLTTPMFDALDPGGEVVGDVPADRPRPVLARAAELVAAPGGRGLGRLRPADRHDPGLRRPDHQPGPGAGDVGEPAGPGGRALRHRVRGVLDRLGDPDRRPVRAESPGAQPDDGDPGRRNLRRRFSDRAAGIHLLAR